jgi:GNAT superfamily N-acetyltransferase
MKNSFFVKLEDPIGLAVLDVVEYYTSSYMITRVYIPQAHRGKGLGSRLLKEVCEEADKADIRLFLVIAPSEGLTYDQLDAWYRRYGFRLYNGIMWREPNT